MKTHLTIFLLIMASGVFAQQNPINLDETFRNEKTDLGTAATPTFIDQRITAKTNLNISTNSYDSVAYHYATDTSKWSSVNAYYQLNNGSIEIASVDSVEINSANQIVSRSNYTWNVLTSEFDLNTHTVVTHATNIDTFLTQKYNVPNNTWTNKNEFILAHHPNGNTKVARFSKWDTNLGQWKLSYEFKFKESGALLERTSFWSDGLGFKTIFEIDSLDRLISKTRYSYDTIAQNFVYLSKSQYSWLNDTVQIGQQFSWDNTLNVWELQKKEVLTYDENGHLAKHITLDSTASGYVNELKNEYLYNSQNKLIQSIKFSWQSDSQTWKPIVKWKYVFDLNNNRIHYFRFNWSSADLEWVLMSRRNRYYEDYENGLVGIHNTPLVQAKVYPNPCSDRICFDIGQTTKKFDVKIYSTVGKLLIKKKVSDNQPISISHLPQGTYYYIIKGKDFGANGQFVTF